MTEVLIRKFKCGSDTHMTSCSKYCPFNKDNVASNSNLKKNNNWISLGQEFQQ